MPFTILIFVVLIHIAGGYKEHDEIDTKRFAVSKDHCQPTPADVYGPYYVPFSRRLTQYCTGDPQSYYNHTLTVHGHVLQEDCHTGIPDTTIELWQADVNGRYHGVDCRGYIVTDKNGFYEFTTVNPGRYAIDRKEQLLRPRHIHFKVHGGLYHVGVVTQMYFKGDPYLGLKDACTECSSGKKELRTTPRLFCDSHLCIATVKFDVVLRRKSSDQHIQRDMFNVVKEISD